VSERNEVLFRGNETESDIKVRGDFPAGFAPPQRKLSLLVTKQVDKSQIGQVLAKVNRWNSARFVRTNFRQSDRRRFFL